MTRSQNLSHYRQPGDYHGENHLHSDVLTSLCLPDNLCPVEGRKRYRRSCGRRVMLVQRRNIELQVMAEMLRVLGYRVTPVEESDAALLYFGRESFGVVISDLDMPHLDGFQLARCIRKHSPHTRILLMTACCQAEVVSYMDGRVVDGWLFKPYRMDVLKDMLKSVLHA